MLALIPILAFTSIFLRINYSDRRIGWRRSFLRSWLVWGCFLVLATEGLSLIHGVTRTGLSLVWLIPSLVSGAWLWQYSRKGGRLQLRLIHLPTRWDERFLLALSGAVAVITALVAWLAPPHTWDSLNYHMPRVAHWAQEGAVRHFATGIDVQNSMPPGAEMIILNFYVLSGSDRLANFVQWFSMIGCLVGVSVIAKQLGAKSLGQVLAVAASVSIPMGIVQASSTMTDYVVAFWVVCLAVEALTLLAEPHNAKAIVLSSMAVGLALLTKPIAAAYVLPFAAMVALVVLKKWKPIHLLAWGGIAALLVISINAGHLARNIHLYGNPISSQGRIAEHANQLLNPVGIVSNVVRNAALHTGTPWGRVNKVVYETVEWLHQVMDIDLNDPRTTSVGPYPWITFRTMEDMTGNLLHAFLILVSFVVTIAARKQLGSKVVLYALVTAVTFVLFSSLFKWQKFGSRYHLSFFVLFTPLVGLLLHRYLGRKRAVLAAAVLILASYPWLLSIDSRPLIPNPKRSRAGSILAEPRADLYYANAPHLAKPYRDLSNLVKEAKCSTVGLMLRGGSAESPLWMELGAPRSDLLIDWIITGLSDIYRKPGFTPCAIICEGCEDWDTFRDMPSVYNAYGYRLYADPVVYSTQ